MSGRVADDLTNLGDDLRPGVRVHGAAACAGDGQVRLYGLADEGDCFVVNVVAECAGCGLHQFSFVGVRSRRLVG